MSAPVPVLICGERYWVRHLWRSGASRSLCSIVLADVTTSPDDGRWVGAECVACQRLAVLHRALASPWVPIAVKVGAVVLAAWAVLWHAERARYTTWTRENVMTLSGTTLSCETQPIEGTNRVRMRHCYRPEE